MGDQPLRVFEIGDEDVDQLLKLVKETREELRELRKVFVWRSQLDVVDINGDIVRFQHLGYLDERIVPVLDVLNAAYKRESIHDETRDRKEFKTGRRYPWANDRVM